MRRIATAAAALCALAACSDAPSSPGPQTAMAPSAPSLSKGGAPIAGQYIVRYRPGAGSVQLRAQAMAAAHGATLGHVYSAVFEGAVMKMSAAAAQALAADPQVLSVEQDQTITLATTQSNPTWGLDRIDQRTRPLSLSYSYTNTGAGVTVYIVDTGINFGQADFQGRAITGVDIVTTGGTAADCNGHGTHVAGTVGSATYGVAKQAKLVAVRVMDCSGNGSMSGVIAGLDWIKQHVTKPAVVNMSIGGGFSSTLNNAVESTIAAGITHAIAAGNNGVDACGASPASAPSAITVGATDSNDSFQSWSNWGSCVRINAPGAAITSLWLGTGTNTISGTSMATPHVAGAAALYLQANPTATPLQVRSALTANATSGVIPSVPTGTPNLLLYTGFMNTAPAPTPPVASFTSSCTFLGCSFDASATTALTTATYTWSFGDATSGSGKTTTHNYATAGTYTVTLTVSDANGTSTKTATVNPVANKAPTAAISSPATNATFTRASNGTVAVTFTGSGTDPESGTLSGSSLVWTSSRDGQIGTGTTFTKSDLSVGTHTITLTAKDPQGLAGTTSVIVTINAAANQAPTVSITSPAAAASFASGASVTFTGSANDPETGALSGASLVWTSSRDGQIGTGTTFTKSNLTTGTHTITLTATDPLGATTSASVSITVNAPTTTNQAPVASFTWVCGPTVSTIPHSCRFDGSASTDDAAVVTWVWKIVPNWSPSRTVPVTTLGFDTAGTYPVTLTVIDAAGLTGSITKTVIVP